MALVLVVVALIVTSYISPTISTSRQTLFDLSNAKTGFRVTLNHVDSNGNFTQIELLQRAMDRGRRRMQSLYAMTKAASSPDIDTPVYAGDDEFLMELSIGTPPVPFSAILDTGSDLIWTQCKPCEQCYQQPTPLFDPKKSSSYSKLPCSSNLCEALPMSKCDNGNCEYGYEYGDSSSTQGVMAFETFTFDNVQVPNVGFGCGHANQGGGFDDGAGLVGMGRGPLSLVSQLDEPKFSYCLTSLGSNGTSTLLVGSKASVNTTNGDVMTTTLIKSSSASSSTFYYLSLQGITVGGTKLAIDNSTFALQDDGTGGMIIDSGTTLTYLEESAYDLLKKEFTKQIKVPVTSSEEMGLDVCFTSTSFDVQVSKVPKITFHFDGGDLDLPQENYLIGDSNGRTCLAMASSQGSSGFSIFGNVQQQNMLVLYDLAEETISFMPTQCDQL